MYTANQELQPGCDEMCMLILDAGPLITSCKFSVAGKLVIDYLLEQCQIAVAASVRDEMDCIQLAGQPEWKDVTLVMDDHLAYLVSDRLGQRKRFLLDVIADLARADKLADSLAVSMVDAVRSRYPPAFVEHTLLMLGR
jgi:hypothetical protein